ncbi:hypothetical protein [Fusobacterium vincentii ATCC 49256]|uniref:Uncharacterized protein n=1 Tax=Fusobacterium vincentii ATCC 49256 TaxID=209882 RepID=Q7P402_FUSVC|nr:hypothetical protein [Fusobacterium vincentii ATCC 49256]
MDIYQNKGCQFRVILDFVHNTIIEIKKPKNFGQFYLHYFMVTIILTQIIYSLFNLFIITQGEGIEYTYLSRKCLLHSKN